MAGLAMAIPRGAMVIDLAKRRRGKMDVDGADTVATWNAKNPQHPRSGDGRWASTAGDVISALQDWASPRTREDTGLGDWEAADLKSAKVHVTNLARAIEQEEMRRKGDALNAKPLKVTKPVKPVDPAIVAKVAEIRKRPIPGDRDYLERTLKGLTVAQIESLAPDLEISGSGTKAQKIEDKIRLLTSRLAGEAITHSTHDTAMGGDLNASRKMLQEEFKRRKALAVERGDREEYAALVAGFGIAGTGPGLPPERVPEKVRGGIEAITPARLEDVTMGERAGAAMHARNKARAGAGLSERDRALIAKVEAENAGEPTREQAAARAKKVIAGLDEVLAKKPLKATKPAVKPNDGSALTSSWMSGTFAMDIEAVIAKPGGNSPALLTDMLGRLKVSELGDLAAKHKVKLLGRTKKEKIESFVDSTVQNKLNSQAIRESTGGSNTVGGKPGVMSGSADDIANLDRRIEDLRVKSRDSRSESQRASLDDKRRRLEAERAALGGAADTRPAGGNRVAPSSREGRDAGAPPQDVGPRYLSTPRKIEGSGLFFEGNFHPDGRMGGVWQGLNAREASEDIDGMRLDDALAETMRMGYDGAPGRIKQQMARFQEIIGQVKDPKVKRDLEYAFSQLKPQAPHGLSAKELADAPEPLRKLMEQLVTIPDTGQGGGEVGRLADIMRRWSAGQLSALRLDAEVARLDGFRHESQEGHHEVARAAQRTADEIRAMRRELKRPAPDNTAEIKSTREAIEEARANLVSQYGEDPDRWPEARQDREVEAYFDLRDKLARLEGR